MKFTMAQPERSCHPETLLPGARTVVSAALCYYAPEPERPGRATAACRATRGSTATPSCARSSTSSAAGSAARTACFVDANQHVDREAAARSGVGFYGKNTLLITRRHGSWVVLGTLVTDLELEATPPLDADCGECRLCIDACPTDALDEPGTLDATKCLSYWTQAPAPIPEDYREHLGAQVYGCDICQDVCPWNRGVEKRRAGEPRPAPSAHVSLVDWLRADADELRAATTALRAAQRRPLAEAQRARRGRQRRRRGGARGRRGASRRATTSCCASTPRWALERLGAAARP